MPAGVAPSKAVSSNGFELFPQPLLPNQVVQLGSQHTVCVFFISIYVEGVTFEAFHLISDAFHLSTVPLIHCAVTAVLPHVASTPWLSMLWHASADVDATGAMRPRGHFVLEADALVSE